MTAWKRRNPRRRDTAATRAQRKQVLTRDRYVCQMQVPGVCIYVASEDDHIIPLGEGGTDALSNRRAVCPPCHLLKTKEESARGRKRYHARRKEQNKRKHPGYK